METLQALILSLPAHNSTMRMRVWRALKESGCAVLRDGVHVVPTGTPASAALKEIESDIRSTGGFAMTVELHLTSDEQKVEVRKLFDRRPEYAELLDRVKKARASLRRLGPRKARTLLDRLQRQFDRLSAIDFFAGSAKAQATDAIGVAMSDYRQIYARGEPRVSRRRLRALDRAKYQGRTWATRKNAWIDRLASAWLIKRFIDRGARFVWLERPSQLPRNAVGYDFDGAEFTHVGNRVTFEVLAETFRLDGDPALRQIGTAVHFLDVGGVLAPDAKGLETVLRGVKEKASDDDALHSEAMRIFDHFYSAYAEREGSPEARGLKGV